MGNKEIDKMGTFCSCSTSMVESDYTIETKSKNQEAIDIQTKNHVVSIENFGVHTGRYNSVVHSQEQDLLVYTRGNSIILKSLTDFRILDTKKIMDETIMVVRQTSEKDG